MFGLLPRPGSGKKRQQRGQVLKGRQLLLVELADLKTRGKETSILDLRVYETLIRHSRGPAAVLGTSTVLSTRTGELGAAAAGAGGANLTVRGQ